MIHNEKKGQGGGGRFNILQRLEDSIALLNFEILVFLDEREERMGKKT